MYDFKNKTVIVTGGTKGVGLGITQAFLNAGATVYICGRNAPDTLPTENNNTAHFIKADVRKPEDTQAIIDAAINDTGHLDILVNNAGGSPPSTPQTPPSNSPKPSSASTSSAP